MRASIVALCLVSAGCGSGGGGAPVPLGDGGSSTGSDLATAPDLTPVPDLVAAPPDLAPGPDMAGGASCGSPQDCNGNPCCVKINMGTFAGAMCTASMTDCPPDILGKMQTRACVTDTDCTRGAQGTSENLCCTGKMGNQMGKVCANQFIAMLSGGALTCP